MSINLILPVAGKSSRFPNLKPKWMLTHPSGKFMLIESILGLNLEIFNKIFITYLKEDERKYSFIKALKEELSEINIINKVNFIELDESTNSQAETVYKTIKLGNINGSIFIKDSDNYFKFNVLPINGVCYYDLNQFDLLNIRNKSYLVLNDDNYILNIIEKQIISPYFSCGGYSFEDVNDFIKSYENIKLYNNDNYEIYISNIIFELLLYKKQFKAFNVKNYIDWGTINDWNFFKKKYATIFIDIDGVLVENSSAHFPPYIGESKPIEENIKYIKALIETGTVELIITTSRKEIYRKITENQLKDLGIKYKLLIMNLYHAKRFIINDYSKSNIYKSCESINIARNSDELYDKLSNIL